jgi:hypothetical protein
MVSFGVERSDLYLWFIPIPHLVVIIVLDDVLAF